MISVIIPLYNKEAYIQSTLHSLLGQQGVDFEVVVVDDGSTDRSADLVEQIGDPRIKLVRQPNGGPSSARNTGVLHAKNEWILYLDADDSLLPEALSTFAAYIRQHADVDCFFCNFYLEEEGKRVLYSHSYKEGRIKNCFKDYLFRRCLPRTGASVFRKSFLQQYPFQETLRRYEDLEQLFRMFEYGRFYRIEQPLFVYQTDGATASQPRHNWTEDFAAHLQLQNRISWRNIAYYLFFLQAKRTYPQQCNEIYSDYEHFWCLNFATRLVTVAEKLCDKLLRR